MILYTYISNTLGIYSIHPFDLNNMLIVTLALFEKPILIYYVSTVHFLPLAILAKVSPYTYIYIYIIRAPLSEGDSRDIVYKLKKKKLLFIRNFVETQSF